MSQECLVGVGRWRWVALLNMVVKNSPSGDGCLELTMKVSARRASRQMNNLYKGSKVCPCLGYTRNSRG